MTLSDRDFFEAARVAGVLETLYRHKVMTMADLIQRVVLAAPQEVPALTAHLLQILERHPLPPDRQDPEV
jgi:hypothetical protein